MGERKYKEFVIGELFDIHPTKAYKITNRQLYETKGRIPVVSNSSSNNGIGGYCGLKPTEKGGIITFSDTTTGPNTLFYQPDDFIGYPHVQGLYPLDDRKWSGEASLYLIAAIKAAAGTGWSYANKFTRAFVSKLNVRLPVTTTGSIDWDFMTDYIRELEQERIRELDAYLKAAGLDNYELDAEDKRVLALYREAIEHKNESEKCELQFGEFLLSDIAKLYTGNKFDKNKMKHSSPGVNFVSRTANNNGISDFVDVVSGVDPYPAGCITLAFGGSIGSCFLQGQPFYTGQNVGVIKLGGDISNESKLYFATVLRHKCQSSFTAFSDEINKHFKTDLAVDLPLDDQGMPDWIFMEKYIKAIEKISVANVVKYKNKVIAATKQVVNGNSVSAAAAA